MRRLQLWLNPPGMLLKHRARCFPSSSTYRTEAWIDGHNRETTPNRHRYRRGEEWPMNDEPRVPMTMLGNTLNDFRKRCLLAVALLAWAMAAGSATASTDSIAPFFGVFKGESIADPTGLLTVRDIDIEIRQTHQGFTINWHSVVIEHEGTERASHQVRFERTHKPGIYRAHRPPDITGNARSPDPIDGHPYYWARLADNALTVYLIQIATDGSVDLRIYLRKLTGNQIQLKLTRLRDGQPLATTNGVLMRKGE